MHWLSRLFHRSKQDAQLDSELRFHVEQQTADNIAAGIRSRRSAPSRSRAIWRRHVGEVDYTHRRHAGSFTSHCPTALVQGSAAGNRPCQALGQGAGTSAHRRNRPCRAR
jgi:hypothetical protein